MAHLRGLGERIETAGEALRLAAALFDAERFFESYVHFALAWKRSRAPGHRGLAQVAAGLCHLQRGNPEGAGRLLRKGHGLLVDAAVDAEELGDLLPGIERCIRALEAGDEVPFPRLPERFPRR